MSSPEQEQEQEKSKAILFRFCSECSNLLFPKEDKAAGELLFACRTCAFTEKANSACVMRHDISSTVGATAGVTKEVAQDPTLPRITRQCPACDDNQAVYFQSQQRTLQTGMAIYFVCCACGHVATAGAGGK